MKIIDAHAHLAQCIAGFGSQGELRAVGGGDAVYPTGRRIALIPECLGEYDVRPERVLELMDREGVERAVLLQGNYLGFQNEITAQAVAGFPERFAGAATYDPFCRERDGIRDRLFGELGFRIVKFEVSTGSGLMSYHEDIPLDGPLMDEAYAYAAARDHVFVIDIGKPGSPSSQVEALRRAILRYPGMRFVVCHLLAPGMADEAYMREGLARLNLPNVWFDLASLPSGCRPEAYPYPTARRYVGIAKGIVGADRLLFGSDLPSTLRRDSYAHLRDYLLESDALSDGEKELVFRRNALEVYFGAR
jgi:predicted TIM-barrel fold metal-dependent hydrolase